MKLTLAAIGVIGVGVWILIGTSEREVMILTRISEYDFN
jgi:hypothetical protein